MSLPDVSGALDDWLVPILVKTITRETVDFVDANVVTGRTIQAVVQPQSKRKINPEIVDWSKQYQQVHSKEPMLELELIEFEGADYKIVELGPYGSYGYTEAIAESTNVAVVVVP